MRHKIKSVPRPVVSFFPGTPPRPPCRRALSHVYYIQPKLPTADSSSNWFCLFSEGLLVVVLRRVHVVLSRLMLLGPRRGRRRAALLWLLDSRGIHE